MSDALAESREPSLWDELLVDPTIQFDARALRLTIADQRSWSRAWLYPVVRVVSFVLVSIIAIVKRIIPGRLSAHTTMDRLCIWFLRRFVSPGAGELLIRHFIVETNLLNFVLANTRQDRSAPVTLQPTTLPELGNRAVIEHDLNVYQVLIEVGEAARERGLGTMPFDRIDFSMLDVPKIDAEPGRRRLLRLDIQTALCLMNIAFVLCLTSSEYRRAVHSLRLDESLLSVLTVITGDQIFRSWRPAGGVIRVDSTVDVPRKVYEHAVLCEYAHAYLESLPRSRP